jgi:outer membrane protein OmpA-like peptidoglycan-associated protein
LYTPGTSLYTPGTSLYNTGITLTPGVEVQETPKEIKIKLRGDILFDFDKANIRKTAEPTLNQIVQLILKYPNAVIRIAGFTDSKGSVSYNLDLSRRRASSVKAWLASRGIPENIMSTKGYGAEHPVAPNTHPDGSDDPDGRQKNRRVEITIRK